ncbi:hypothetical protein BDQ12DRAFT_576632, partial [Crucibulum laeve]
LAVVVILEGPLSIVAVGKLLNLKCSSIVYVLLGLQAILLIPENDHDEPVQLFHTSLRGYLCTKERSREICINLQQTHATLAIKCLQVVVDYTTEEYCIKDTSIDFYASNYWLHHLHQSL